MTGEEEACAEGCGPASCRTDPCVSAGFARAEQLARAVHGSEDPFWVGRMKRVLAAIDADPETYGYRKIDTFHNWFPQAAEDSD